MNMLYNVFWNNTAVGQACVTREGLYYHIVCCCKFSVPDFYRITLEVDGKRMDLGICVPDNDGYCVNKKIACSKLGEGKWHFTAKTSKDDHSQFCIAISDDMAMPNFAMLPHAYLVNRNENLYLQIKG